MASDNFDRADSGTLGAQWTEMAGPVGHFTVESNVARIDAFGETCATRYSADTPADDQEASCNLDVNIESTLDKGGGPACRMSASEDTYYFTYANTDASGEFQYAKNIAGVVTQLGAYTTAAAPTLGQSIGIRAVGTTISVLVDGSEVASTTDSAIASGNCGLAGYPWIAGTASFDNWVGAGTEAEVPEASLTWLVPIAAA